MSTNSKTTLIMLSPDWPVDVHRRTVTMSRGKTKMLVFERGKPLELTPGELNQLSKIIGKAIVEVTRDEKGKVRVIEHDDSRRLEPGPIDVGGV